MAPALSRLARAFGVEPAEVPIFLYGATTFFLIHTASVALANVADTFFLKRVGVNFLPLAFLASSLLLVVTTTMAARLAARRAHLPLLTRTLLLLAALLIPLWLLILANVQVVYGLLVLVSKQVESIASLLFWVALGGLLHARQAKRLYAPIVAGGTLGEIFGSFASGAIGQRFGIPALMPAAALVLLLAAVLAARGTALAPRRLTRAPRHRTDGAPANALPLFRPLWRESRLFRILAVSALLCGTLGPMLYFQFSYVADLATRGADAELRLLALYAKFRGWLSVAVLALQLAGTARLFRRVGVPLAATLSPLVYALGFFSVSARLGLEAAIGAMAGATLQDHAIYDPAQRILATLFPERLRPAATSLIEGPVQRTGGALGNLIVLATVAIGTPAWVGVAGLPIAGLWVAAALLLWRIYPSLLLEVASTRLFRHHDAPTAPELVDAGTVRMLEAALAGADPHRVRAACALVLESPLAAGVAALARSARRAPPERRRLLIETLHRMLEQRGEGRVSVPAALVELEALLEHESAADPLTQALLVEAYARLAPDFRPGSRAVQVLQRFCADPVAAVRLAATARLSAAGALTPGDGLDETLAAALAGDDPAARHIALDELRTLLLERRDGPPDERWTARLIRVADRLIEPQDRARAAEVLADVAARFGPHAAAQDDRLLDHIDDPDSRVRIAVLRFTGGAHLETPLRHVVDRLVSDDGSEAAAAAAAVRAAGPVATHALIDAVLHGRRATRDAALPLLRELHVQPAVLRGLIDDAVALVERLVLQRYGLASGPRSDLVLQRLRERGEDTLHSILLLLAALHDDDRLAALARLLARSPRGRARATLLEALEALLRPAERDRLLPLLDDDVRRAAAAAGLALGRELPSFGTAVRDTLAERDSLTITFLSAALAPAVSGGTAPAALAEGDDLLHSERDHDRASEAGVLKQVERVLQLRSLDLFAGLTTRQLSDLAAVMREEAFAAGSAIVREGEFGDCMYIIVTGTVHINRTGEYRGAAGPGEFVGEMSLFDGETRSATATAVDRVHLLRLERQDLLELMEEQPSIAIAMCQTLARRVRAAMSRGDSGEQTG